MIDLRSPHLIGALLGAAVIVGCEFLKMTYENRIPPQPMYLTAMRNLQGIRDLRSLDEACHVAELAAQGKYNYDYQRAGKMFVHLYCNNKD